LAAGLLATGLSSGPATAQEGSAALEEVVVSGRQLEEKLSTELQDYGHRVVTVTGDQIRAAGFTNVSQALSRLVPGFYLRENNRNSRTMRLNGSGQFLVLLDGVRLNNRMFGSTASPNAVGVNMVERVEVLMGGEGLFYGTDAVGGVVNIVTRNPTEELSGQIDLKAESMQGREASFHVSGGRGGNNLLFHGHYEKYPGFQSPPDMAFQAYGSYQQGQNRKSSLERSNLGFKYSREFEPAGKAKLDFSFIRNDMNYDTPSPGYIAQYYTAYEHISYLKWAHDVSDGYSYFVKLYFHEWWAKWTGLQRDWTYESHMEKFGFTDYGLNVMNSYRFSQGSELIFGLDYQNYGGYDVVMRIPKTPREQVYAVYASFRPYFSAVPGLKTAFSARYSYMEEQSSTVWNVSARVPFLNDAMYAAMNVGTTFRLPSGSSLYSNPAGAHGGNTWGNPDLKAEETLYATASLGGRFKAWGFDITGFYSETDGKIATVRGSGPGGMSMYRNVDGKTHVRGITLSADVSPADGLNASASFTYQTEIVNGVKTGLGTIPRSYGNLNVTWEGRLNGVPLGFGVYNVYTGKQHFSAGRPDKQYGDYWTADLSLFVKPAEKFTVTLQVTNLFDRDDAYSMGSRAAAGTPAAPLADPDGIYYYENRLSPISATLSLTYDF
jgi:vitamin B12 transporter